MPERAPVSVLIPAYNAAAFLPRTIATIRAQSMEADEVIVVDDESTDDTAAVAQRLGARVLQQRRGGPAGARNAGLRIAKHDWIATLDADDLWHPRKLQLQLDAVRVKPDLGLVFADFDAVSDSDGQVYRQGVVSDDPGFQRIRRTALTPFADLLDFGDFLRELATRPVIQPSTALFRRKLAIEIGGFLATVRAEDSEFFLRFASRTTTGFVNLPLTAYTRHSSQVTEHRDLDTVRLELHHHVMAHPTEYHDLILAAFKKEYARTLYFSAAHAASKRRFPAAVALLSKAVAVASARGQLPALLQTGMRSRLLATGRGGLRQDALGQSTQATVRDVEIPWRRVGQHLPARDS